MSSNRKGLAEKIWCKMLHLYFRATRGLSLGVRAVVLNGCGEVLLVRHTYTSGWQFPGGGVEPNETIETALARELEEETGLKLVGMPNLHGIFLNREVSKRDHVLVYICETACEVSARSPSPEISSLSFFDLAHLPEDIEPGTRQRLDEISRREKVAQEWEPISQEF